MTNMTHKKTVVAVSGAFDPIHVGYIKYIRGAAKLGDRLVVILNKDDFLLRKKGFVFMPFAERKEILENIKEVDEVIASIDDDQTVNKTLEMLKPDVFAKGGAGLQDIPEAETCRKIGAKLIINVGGSIIHADLSQKVKDMGMENTVKFRINCPYCDDHPILKEKCNYCKGTGKIVIDKLQS